MTKRRSREETKLIRAILVALSRYPNVRAWRAGRGKGVNIKTGQHMTFNPPGCSDIVGIARHGLLSPGWVPDALKAWSGSVPFNGILLAIEAKSPRGRLTMQQRAFLEMVRSFGGRAGVARSVNDAVEIATGTGGRI